MLTVNELMLEAVRLMELVHSGVATGGSTSTLEDTALTDPAGTYTGGTLWMKTGDNAGLCLPIETQGNGVLTFATQLVTIAAGDEYEVAGPQFPTWLLQQAIRHVLLNTLVPYTYTATIVNGVITLPANVSNVKQIYIANTENFHWDEYETTVVFDNQGLNTTAVLHYMTPASKIVGLAGETSTALDPLYVAWSAVVFLWRNLIERIHKDNPSAIDLLNEAKNNEALALAGQRMHPLAKLTRSPRYSKWIIS
jgi:hypothetical protein